ncbi:MAG: mechanosensitive ion channel [Woeseiaceae bacterium]|nr:mechanosensitive ion channel [Woeseiaceae bacterium]
MSFRRPLCILAALIGLLSSPLAAAQETADADAPPAPDIRSLQTDWWAYFEGPRETVEARADDFVTELQAGTAGLEPQNQVIAQSLLTAVRDDFTAYLSLLDDAAVAPDELPAAADSYSIDDLLGLAADARSAQLASERDEREVEREQRLYNEVSRRRDAAYRDYVAVADGDARFLAGLRLIEARAAQAISSRRLALLSESFQHARDHADALAARVELAEQRLAPIADDAALEAIRQRVADNAAAVEAAQETVRAAQIDASGLDLETERGRLQQRLEQQRLLDAEVALAVARVTLAQSQAQQWLAELQLDVAPDLDVLQEQALAWSELQREVALDVPEWQRQTEDELLAVQTTRREGMDRASRRLLDERLNEAQATLARIGELDAAVADLQLLGGVVDNVVAEYSGAFRSWLSNLSRAAKGAYLRIAELANVRLVTIGEAPVTGGDILRIIIILIVALLLSRGVRRVIQRVGESEDRGTQASMYTVGRLTHYAIIIIAGFIALGSIGLDFSNLALVAGALSVGIGFGLQSIVNNFVSGLIILFEHTLRVGDYIELDTGLTGTVKAINVRSTLINTNDNIDIVVPNSEFVTSRMTNWTLGESILRVRIPFGVAYGSDKELVRQAALEAAAEVPYTLKHIRGREPDIWLVEYGDNSLNFLLLVWVNLQGARRPTRTRAAYLWALEDKFREYGIEIPFPQRDLHLRSGWPPPGDRGK